MTTKVKGTEGIEFHDSTVQVTAADTGPTVRADTSNQSIPNNAATIVAFTTTWQNLGGGWDGSRFTPQRAGTYLISARITFSNGPLVGERTVNIRRNGSDVRASDFRPSVAGPNTVAVQALIAFNGSADFVEITAYQDSGGALTLTGLDRQNYFGAVRVSS